MREIKFRAWDGKKMWPSVGFVDSDVGRAFYAEEYMVGGGERIWDVKHLMQFTGLKDKNGKEIYEGDVIAEEETVIHDGDTFKNTDKFINVRKVENYKYFVGDIGTRWFGQRKHQVLWAADSCGFEPFSDSTNNCGHCGGGKSSNDVEVIGNIYDNPELIQK